MKAAGSRFHDAMHFRSLNLENVRSFAERQTLDLSDGNGGPNRWCLVLGENGVGKTTLMQALAVMRPRPGYKEEGYQPGPNELPTFSQPELSDLENDDINRFLRRRTNSSSSMMATLCDSEGDTVRIGAHIAVGANGLKKVEWIKAPYELGPGGPLVIGYGAGRHVGHRNQAAVAERSPVASLFADSMDLYDAEELVELLHHGTGSGRRESRARDIRRLHAVFAIIGSLIDEEDPPRIVFRGPRTPGRSAHQSGVHVRTPSGTVPLSSLSLGSQAVFAWIVDLAYRLLTAFPDSPNALAESAVVFVDEIDLHLHPRWQRNLRGQLLKHFPRIQFIATTHSPVTALEAIANGGKVAVVYWDGDGARILNDPLPRRDWRYDQLMTSPVFEFTSARGRHAEALMTERVTLVRVRKRTAKQERRLRELDAYVAKLPVSATAAERSFERLMEEYREDFPERARD